MYIYICVCVLYIYTIYIVHIYIYIQYIYSTCTYIYSTYIYIIIYIYVHDVYDVYIYIYTYIHIHMCILVCLCMCTYVHIWIYLYTHYCICIYIYKHVGGCPIEPYAFIALLPGKQSMSWFPSVPLRGRWLRRVPNSPVCRWKSRLILPWPLREVVRRGEGQVGQFVDFRYFNRIVYCMQVAKNGGTPIAGEFPKWTIRN